MKLWRSWTAITILVLGIFFALGTNYIQRSGTFNQHDLDGHVEYSVLIAHTHHLPLPHDGWQTYHPPLFYLLTQPFHPLQSDRNHFMDMVRYANLIGFGGLFIICLLGCAAALALSKKLTLLVVLYVCTLPSVVILFTSFNNDAAAIGFTSLVAFASLKYYKSSAKKQSFLWLLTVLLAGTLALYTKYTALLGLGALGLFLLGYCIATRSLQRKVLLLGATYVGAIILLFPWLFFHNKPATGKLFPHNVETPETMAITSLHLHVGKVAFILSPPGLQPDSWRTPYAIDNSRAPLYWSKQTLISSALSTSLYDEWDQQYNTRHSFGFSLQTWSWLGLWAQLAFFLFLFCFRTKLGRIALWLSAAIVATHIYHLAFIQPFMNAANFRYYAWILIPLTVAYVAAMEKIHKNQILITLSLFILIVGVCAHMGFIYASF
jgi:hypothetical protein